MTNPISSLDVTHRFEWSCDGYYGWLEVPLAVLHALDFTPTSELSRIDMKRKVGWLDDGDGFSGNDMDRFAAAWKRATGATLLYNYNKLSTHPRCPADEHPIRQFPIFSLDLLTIPA